MECLPNFTLWDFVAWADSGREHYILINWALSTPHTQWPCLCHSTLQSCLCVFVLNNNCSIFFLVATYLVSTLYTRNNDRKHEKKTILNEHILPIDKLKEQDFSALGLFLDSKQFIINYFFCIFWIKHESIKKACVTTLKDPRW